MVCYSPACDEELFVDSPDGWVAQELEGANTETRRRAAVDFVRASSFSLLLLFFLLFPFM